MRRTNRRGIFLPIVLVCIMLLVGIAIAFQFISASDYKQVARWGREAQAEALADLASDEIYTQVADVHPADGVAMPGWLTSLLTKLDAARAAAGTAELGAKESLTFALTDLPATNALATGPETIVTLSTISAEVGPFTLLNQAFTADTYYLEPAFQDTPLSLRPWDLKGAIAVTLQAKGRQQILNFEFGQQYHRDQVLRITDTTPLANKFTLFSFHPSPSEQYAFSDLRSGGTFDVAPALDGPGSRVMLRGPLVIVPDEAPTATGAPAHLGGPNPQAESVGYPDNVYAGAGAMATIPGPRLVMHPAGGLGEGLMGSVGEVLDGLTTEMEPRRASEPQSNSVVKTLPKVFSYRLKIKDCVGFPLSLFAPEWMTRSMPQPELVFNLGDVSSSLAKGTRTASPVFNTVDKDPISYFPASAYFISPGVEGTQTFRILPYFPSYTKLMQSFKGTAQSFGTIVGAPWARNVLNEGDRVTLEPVIRDRTPAANAGLFGLYGVVHHAAKTYSIVPIREFMTWLAREGIERKLSGLVKKVALCNLEDAEVDLVGQALTQLNLTPDLDVVVHRFREIAPPPIGGAMSLGAVEGALTSNRAAILPFGSYHSADSFWASPMGAAKRNEIMQDFQTEKSGHGGGVAGHTATMEDVFTENGSPNYGTVDPNWPAGSFADEVARWLCEDVAGRYLQGFGTGNAVGIIRSLFAGLDGTVGMPTLVDLPDRRPQGAFGPRSDDLPAAVDMTPVRQRFAGSFYPPKYRDFSQIVTRIYDDWNQYAAAEQDATGAIKLKGVVLIRNMNCPNGFTYRGRGILICHGKNGAPAVIGGNVGPATPDSMLLLVHRVPPGEMGTNAPSLRLGATFVGSIYSDNGVQMGGTIQGNLVTGLLFKQRSSDIRLEWDNRIHDPDPNGSMIPYWTVEMNGEVRSAGPG